MADNSSSLVGAIGDKKSEVHFILVHREGMGAWCWYKLQSLLEDEGYKVHVPDLKASGVDKTDIEDVQTFYNYSSPLFEMVKNLPNNDVAILVGNGTGGISIAMAAENYPRKIKALVFLGAFVPAINNTPSFVLDEFMRRVPEDFWKDTKYPSFMEPCDDPKKFLLLGPDFLKSNLYNYSPKENALQAHKLVRTSSLFIEDLRDKVNYTLTEEIYGSVKRWVIISKNNGTRGPQAITEEFNKWQMKKAEISNDSSITIEELTDDMTMVSNPEKVRDILLDIATMPC